MLVLLAWNALATMAFAAGGQFHRHYWVILAFPLGTVAGATVSLHPRAWVQATVAALVVAVPLLHAERDIRLPRDQVPVRLSADGRLTRDEEVARWFDARRQPGDSLYALCASAGLYANARVDPPFPYLWFDNVVQVPGARQRLEAMFSSPRRPTYVAVYERAQDCDPGGVVAEALRDHYKPVGQVGGIDIYERIA